MNAKNQYFEYGENEFKVYPERSYSNEDKIRYLRDFISKEGEVNNLFKSESIDTNLLNKCNRDFIEVENGKFVHNVKSEVTSFEINYLKNQNLLLKQLIAQLSNENKLLRSTLNNSRNDNKQISD